MFYFKDIINNQKKPSSYLAHQLLIKSGFIKI